MVVFLDLDVEAADPIIVQLNGISLFATDGDGRFQALIHATPIGSVQYPQRDR